MRRALTLAAMLTAAGCGSQNGLLCQFTCPVSID